MENDASTPVSISTRIAALKLNEVARAPTTKLQSAFLPPPPAPTKRHPPNVRGKTINNPPLYSYGSATERATVSRSNDDAPDGPPPAYTISRNVSNDSAAVKPSLPPRVLPRNNTTTLPKPVLPPRRPSEQSSERRASIESQSSGISTASFSSYSSNASAATIRTRGTSPCPSTNSDSDGRKLPPVYDPLTLPVQFESQDSEEKCRGRNPQKSYWASTATKKPMTPRSLPPPLPPTIPREPSPALELELDVEEDWKEFPARPEPSPNRLGDWKRSIEPTRRPGFPATPPPPPRSAPKRSVSMFGTQTLTVGNVPPPMPPRRPSAPTGSSARNVRDTTPPPIPSVTRPKTEGFRYHG